LLGRLPDGCNELQNTTDIKQADFHKGKSRLKETSFFLAKLIFIDPIIFHTG
jgi:hypothetical protein